MRRCGVGAILLIMGVILTGSNFASAGLNPVRAESVTLPEQAGPNSLQETGDLIVKLADDAGPWKLLQIADILGTRNAISMVGKPGGRTYLLKLGPGLPVEQALSLLQPVTGIVYAEPNHVRTVAYTPTDSGFPDQWALENNGQTIGGVAGTTGADIGASETWGLEQGTTNPVTVAVIDTGIDKDHPDLRDRIWRNEDETPGNGVDDDGNGFVDDVNGYNWAGISQEDSRSVAFTFGLDTGNQTVAQSIQGTGEMLTHVGVLLDKKGNPTGGITVSLKQNRDGADLASFAISPAEVGEKAEIYRQLSQPVRLVEGATYYLVLHTDNVGLSFLGWSTNHYHLYDYAGMDVYREGQEWRHNGSSWSANTGFDLYFQTNPNAAPHDDYGHGTHVGGIIGAAENGEGSVGISFGAELMPLKIFDSSGSTNAALISEAIRYAADNGAKVINMSLAGSQFSETEQDAVTYAHGKGVAIFAAIGNGGDGTINYPAGYQLVIGVAATDNRDQAASLSDFNANVDLSAPGIDVFSTMPTYPVYCTDANRPLNYAFMSGTSMASPMAAGAASLILSRSPSLAPDEVEECMISTAKDLGTAGRDDHYGWGRLDALGALEKIFPSPAISALEPPYGPANAPVAVTGSGFGIEPGSLCFGSVPATVKSWSDTRIEAQVPSGIGGEIQMTVTNVAGLACSSPFVVRPFRIVASVAAGQGQVSPSSAETGYGGSVSIQIVSEDGYHIKTITDNGGLVPGPYSSPYVINNVTGDHDVVVTFSNTWTVTASVTGGHGTAAPPTQETVPGVSASITITPENHYHIASIRDKGVSVPGPYSSPYVINNVTADHDVVVTFVADRYRVTATAGAGGSINPSGEFYANYGTGQSFAITPFPGYHISSVMDNGASQPLVSPYVIHNMADDHNISVDFAKDGPRSQAASTFYFAEGYTGEGFQEYLCLSNPQDFAARATVTYLFASGDDVQEEVEIPAGSRITLDINNNPKVGAGKQVSLRVESASSILAERPMYFNYRGCTGGSNVVGATSTSTTWYFAEGYTGPGFDEYICVLNPGEMDAALTFRFQTQEAGEKQVTGLTCSARSRASFKVNDLLPGAHETSLKLESSQPVVAERPMYFNYSGNSGWNWTGGDCVMGATQLSKVYYFAEGTTRAGFEEWLTLQNPGLSPIIVSVTYQPGQAQGEPVNKSYEIGAASRKTIYVPAEAGAGKDISVQLTSSSAFLAERPMYFCYTYQGVKWSGGTCVIGAPAVATDWFFAEGATIEGFHEWLCMQNPNGQETMAQVTYYVQGRGAMPPVTETIPAGTRITLFVNKHAGPGLQLSARIRVISGPGIICERPMYFGYGGWDGGHDVMGYSP